MDRAQKEKLMDEILEFKDILDAVYLDVDSMTKGFIMLAFVQEAFSEIKSQAAAAKFKELVVSHPVSVTPPHCPHMGEDIPFKPKMTQGAKGIVVKRSKARFRTAFADDLGR